MTQFVQRRGQSGMTLIEVLVTILIFSIGLLGFVGLQVRAIEFSRTAEDSNRAALLANEIASSMQLYRTVSLPAAQVTEWQSRVSEATAMGLPDGEGVISAGPVTNSATVTITWSAVNSRSGSNVRKYETQVILP